MANAHGVGCFKGGLPVRASKIMQPMNRYPTAETPLRPDIALGSYRRVQTMALVAVITAVLINLHQQLHDAKSGSLPGMSPDPVITRR
ncbi:MAG: hypothetical protein R3D26_22605 [Cyanobacteriota/Melainabacteria group bacterium]